LRLEKQAPAEESKKEESLVDIISSIDEQYFSDLKEIDLFDDDISDVDESEIGLKTDGTSSS
jgi:hypothetical protein